MKSVNSTPLTCTATIKLLGDYWTLRILDVLKIGQLRYCEIQRLLDNVNPVTLTNRLQKLEQALLITRKEDLVDRISVSYSLSAKGKSALPVLEALREFSKKI